MCVEDSSWGSEKVVKNLKLHLSLSLIHHKLCLYGWPAVLCGKNFNIRHYMQTVQPNFCISSMLIGTIDFFHLILHSVTLAMPWGHKVSIKQNLFSHTFHLIRMKFDVVMKHFKLNILRLLLTKMD